MNKEKGSSVIAIIALIAIAVLVGIWIGAEKDSIISDISSTPVAQRIMKKDVQTVKSPETIGNDVVEETVEKTEETVSEVVE